MLDEPRLFSAFLLFQDNLLDYAANRAARGLNTQDLVQARAQLLRIDVASMARVAVVTREAAVALRAVAAQSEAFHRSPAANNVAQRRAAMLTHRLRHEQATFAAINRLRRELSPAAWENLRAYVTEDFARLFQQIRPATQVSPGGAQ